MTAEHAHGIDTGAEVRTGHPLCTELGCDCSGNLPRTRPNPDHVSAGAAVCMCHPVHIATSLGIRRFGCAPETATRASAADAVLAEARRLCCGNNPATHHEATAKHSELMAFAGDLARAARGLA